MPLELSPKRLERELKRLRYELSVAQRQTPYLRALVEGTRDRLCLLDLEGKILEYNSSFAQQFNDPEGVIYGRLIQTVYQEVRHEGLSGGGGLGREAHREAPSIPRALVSLERLDALQESERLYGYLSEEPIEVELSKVMILTQPLIVLSARPLDERATRERELVQAQAKIEQLGDKIRAERERERVERFESLSLLAGTLAHDLNNALAVIGGNLQLLAEFTTQPQMIELLNDVNHGLGSASALVDRLRAFSKGVSSILSPTELSLWLSALVSSHPEAKRGELSFQAREGLQAWVEIDDVQLTQVLINLIMNAFQAYDELTQLRAGEAREVKVQLNLQQGEALESYLFSSLHPLRLEQSYWVISVLDRGPGILPEHLSKILTPFFSTKERGSGLGLASALRIVHSHRGGLNVAQREGGGARFDIALPADQRSAQVDEVPQEESASSIELSMIQVIVMDDEPLVRQMIAKLLRKHKMTVLEASDGAEAISLYRGLQTCRLGPVRETVLIFDLIIESGLSGIETLQQLLVIDPQAKVIACSGHYELDIPNQYRSLGFKGFLAKPFKTEELLQQIKLALSCDELKS